MNTGVSSSNHQTHCSPQTRSPETMLRFRLSTTLLLAAVCSFMAADASQETAVTCGSVRNVQNLVCDAGVIRVQAALYGRKDRVTCSAGRPSSQLANTSCSKSGTLKVVKDRCDGKKECQLNMNLVRNPNPCPGISKYLETNYTCFPANHFTTCEGSLAHLQCDEGQVIFVYGAHYGRRDKAICSFQRPESQLRDVTCSRTATRKVSERCNGKNSCTISVTNSLVGDPCGGIYKYMEVAYICEYPLVTQQ